MELHALIQSMLLNVATSNFLHWAAPPRGTAARMLRKVQVFQQTGRRELFQSQVQSSYLQRRAVVAEMLVNVNVRLMMNDEGPAAHRCHVCGALSPRAMEDIWESSQMICDYAIRLDIRKVPKQVCLKCW